MKKEAAVAMIGLERFIDFLNELHGITKNPNYTNNIILSAVARVVLPAYTKEQRDQLYKTLEKNAEEQRAHMLKHVDKVKDIKKKVSKKKVTRNAR